MKDFVIMSVKNFSYAQNYHNWKYMESFMFLFFGLFVFFLYLYTYNTNSLLMVGAHLMKKKGGIMYDSFL